MKANQFSRSLRLALTGAVLTWGATVAFADIKNYEFKLVEPTVKAGPDRTIAVRLVDKTTGKPVPDAVIFATRLDMAPDAMQEMVTKVTPLPGTEPCPGEGVIRDHRGARCSGDNRGTARNHDIHRSRPPAVLLLTSISGAVPQL